MSIKQIASSPFNDSIEQRSFALNTTPLVFSKCREVFAKDFKQTTEGFLYYQNSSKYESLVSFILKTEQILEIKPSEFSKTNHESISWVEPSEFWKICPMRRSFFTLLMRGSHYYIPEKDNYEAVFEEETWLRKTNIAVKRFLYGFTQYVGPELKINSTGTMIKDGWGEIFSMKTTKEVRKLLISETSSYCLVENNNELLYI